VLKQALLFMATAVVSLPLHAEPATDSALLEAAQNLAKQYDSFYGEKNVDGMTHVYADDAILISPAGSVVKGKDELQAYYKKRFSSGAKAHQSLVTAVHAEGDFGYGYGTFAVTVPTAEGEKREHGNLGIVYVRKPDGWHIQMLTPSAIHEK